MDVTLPSGATVVIRDRLKAKDKFAVQAAMRLSTDVTTGLQESTGNVLNEMRNALLKLVIERWSFEVPVPSVQADALDELDIDDYNALLDAVEPLMSKILTTVPNRSGQSAS
jgi:hypothetical protein